MDIVLHNGNGKGFRCSGSWKRDREVKWVIFLLSQISSNDFRWWLAIGRYGYLYSSKIFFITGGKGSAHLIVF